MSEVTTTIDIKASPEAVWDVVMDPERLQEWVTIHRKLVSHSGDEMEQVMCIHRVNFHVKWDLAVCEHAARAVWKGKGPARSRAETEYVLTPVDGGTRFEYRNEFKPPLGPLGAVAGRALVGGVPEREANASLRRLKNLLEKP
jgi:carbon monoxide dehydrogenase subunit G